VTVPAPLVGRDVELAALRTALKQTAGGNGGLVALVGEAGVGKTRLAIELGHEARARGAVVAWGRCHEAEALPGYWPWLHVLRALAAEVDDDPAPAAALRALEEPDTQAASTLAPPGSARLELFDRVSAALAGIARRGPLVVILDDLHWADGSSLHLLEFAARALAESAVLFVVTHRPTSPDHQSDAASARPDVARLGRRIPVAGLHPDAVAELLARALGVRPRADVVAAVHAASQGNPFFVLEMAALLPTSELASPPPHGSPAVPLTLGLRQVIARRLAPLPGATRDLLTAAAILGPEFDLAPLEAVLGESPEQVLDTVEPAVRAGVVREVAGALRRWTFSHALVREALHDALTPAERAQLHRRAGEALERVGRADVDALLPELAHHFYEAARGGDPAKAAHYGQRAGSAALDRAAYEEAVRHFERARHAAALVPGNDRQRLAILVGLAEAHGGAGDLPAAEAAFGEALPLARALGATEFGDAVVRYGLVRAEMGILDERLVALLEEAIQALPAEDSALRARLLSRLASGLHLQRGALSRRRQLADEAAGMARRVGEPTTLAFVLCNRLVALLGPDNLGERLTAADEILVLSHRAGYRTAALSALTFRVHDLLELADHAAFLGAVERFARLADEARQPFYRWHAATFRAAVALVEGRFGDAEGLATEALALGQRAQSQTALLHYGQQLIKLRGEQGRLDEVLPMVEMAAAEASTVPAWRCSLADLYSVTGRREQARIEFEALATDGFAGIPRDTSWLVAMCLVANVCTDLEDRRRARQLYALLQPYAGMVAASRPAVVAVQPVDGQLGRLATVLGRWSDAARHFDAALDLSTRMRGRPWIAHTQHEYAAMLLARGRPGDRERARALLAEARRTAEELGMQLLLGWIRRTLSRTGPVPRDDVALAMPREEREEREVDLATAVGARVGRRTPVVHLVARGGPPTLVAPSEAHDGARRGSFQREGDVWTIIHDGRVTRLRHAVGLAHLAHLLVHPGEDVHVTDLVERAQVREPRPDRMPDGTTATRADLGDAGAALDAQARADYRHRLGELRDELGEAERFNDVGRAERVRREIDFLGRELSRGVGLGGRERHAASTVERARVSVAKAIRYAIDKIAPHDAALAEHLRVAVRTGTVCTYAPDDARARRLDGVGSDRTVLTS
jgi:tetratricopeptide (TPR) repeat protein